MTSNAPLTPTRIMDKNGRMTTVHRKADTSLAPGTKLPGPPKLRAEKQYSPTEDQLKPKQFRAWFNHGIVDPKLAALANLMPGMPCVFDANDVEFYSVQSVVENDDALLLMQSGVRSAEEAHEVLEREGILDRLVDHSSLTNKALRQQIPATAFCYFVSGRSLDGVDEDNVIDAVKLSATKGYVQSKTNRQLDQLVFEGRIKASDVRSIGSQHFRNSRSQEIVDALERIKSGKTSYDARELRKLLDWVKKDDSNDSLEYDNAIEMADRIGIDATISLRHKNQSRRVLQKLNGAISAAEERDFILHADESGSLLLGRGIAGNRIEGAIALYRSGIDPDTARRHLEEGREVEAIIGGHLNVHNTIVGGWL